METESTTFQNNKLLMKGFIIGLLVILLLIPAYVVKNLVEEREQRQKDAVIEVSSKWAGPQTITGPILVLPYWQHNADPILRTKDYIYLLPDQLDVTANVTPQEKHRGIYKVMLFSSTNKLTGSFKDPNLATLKISEEDIIWNESFIRIGVSDQKGLNSELKMKWNDSSLVLTPALFDEKSSHESLGAFINAKSIEDIRNVQFSIDINLNGSFKLQYTPIGKTTRVNMTSTWEHPSFSGKILPQTSEISDSGFTATWTSLSHTRSFPQQWKGNAYSFKDDFKDSEQNYSNPLFITSSAFGTDLFVPVNGYQKTIRSLKYAILCILLTFTAFFLIETTNKRSVHPVHYALIGFALILFYTLLLSISEYAGFNVAYAIASIATVGLITWFVKGLLKSGKLSLLLSFILVLLYSYVFTTLQLQDYALLLGSIGLFLALAVVMYFSKKIQW